MKFHIFNLVIEVNVLVKREPNHPDHYSIKRRRKVANKIDCNLPYVNVSGGSPKIARVKAIRRIGQDAGYNMGLREAKEWVERTYANFGKGKIL